MENYFDISMVNLTIFIFLLGTIVEASYERYKVVNVLTISFTNKIFGKKPLQLAEGDLILKENWQSELMPAVIGLIVVYLFYPTTMFDFLPFSTTHHASDWVITALVVSRSANGAHEGYKGLALFFQGLVGRLFLTAHQQSVGLLKPKSKEENNAKEEE